MIKEVHGAGHAVLHTLLADNLAEEQGLKLAAKLICAFGIREHDALLVNKARPNPNNISKGKAHHPMCGAKEMVVGS